MFWGLEENSSSSRAVTKSNAPEFESALRTVQEVGSENMCGWKNERGINVPAILAFWFSSLTESCVVLLYSVQHKRQRSKHSPSRVRHSREETSHIGA